MKRTVVLFFVATLLAACGTPAPAARIAFTSDRDGNEEIYVVNTAPLEGGTGGTGLTNLTNNPDFDGFPACSPDGCLIAFLSERDGNGEIYVMNADGSGQTRLTDNPAIDSEPAWSPDGKRIAFTSDRDGNSEIYVMSADGSGQTNLSNNPAGDWLSIPEQAFYLPSAWSPDGKRIAFESSRDGNGEIYVMNSDGTGQTNLTNNPAGDSTPAWSPDGSRIAFVSDLDGSVEIYGMNAAPLEAGTGGSGQTRLTDNPAFDWPPIWCP